MLFRRNGDGGATPRSLRGEGDSTARIGQVSRELIVGLVLQASVNAFKAQVSPVRHFVGAAAMIAQRKGVHKDIEVTRRLLQAIRSNIVRNRKISLMVRQANRYRSFERSNSSALSIQDILYGKMTTRCRIIQPLC